MKIYCILGRNGFENLVNERSFSSSGNFEKGRRVFESDSLAALLINGHFQASKQTTANISKKASKKLNKSVVEFLGFP